MPTTILRLVWYLYFLLVDPAHQCLVPHVVDDPPSQHLLCQAGAHHSVLEEEGRLPPPYFSSHQQ